MASLRAVVGTAVERLGAIGVAPADDHDTRRRKSLLVLIAVIILPVSVTWGVLYVIFGGLIGVSAFVYFAISVASIVVFARTRDFPMLLRIQLLDILLAPTLSMIPLGGILGSGGVGIWGILAPLGALVFGGTRSGIRWYAAYLAVLLGSGVAGIVLGFQSPLPGWFANLVLAMNIAVGGTIVFTLLALFAQQRSEALTALRSEQERSESLLLNILPSSIAARLKSNPQAIADHFDAASVLFADVVDFTPRSDDLSPAEVVGLLDRLFSHFDGLAERHGLEKIKTIGDAYMVAAGVPEARPDHAKVLAMLALEMLEAARPGGEVADLGVKLRIGMSSGPVVAGVLGRKRFLYDLWGDTVNTASRMESQGLEDHIQLTRATYELIKDDFVCESRGTIPVKGKGEMETWYLVGERRDSSRAETAPAGAGIA
jgi:adenylate cyclase